MNLARLSLALLLALVFLLAAAPPADAHQPYFEDEDWAPASPYRVADPTVSTALYATLADRQDVDYVTFTGSAGQRILLGLTIPQIEGQEDFAPTLALIGPELASASLPRGVVVPPGAGAIVLPPGADPPTEFFEPFSRTRYWERQEERITLPADGEYTVAVWAADRAVGRYTLVVGDREIPGGDIAFPFKMRAFWRPVPAPASAPHGCEGR